MKGSTNDFFLFGSWFSSKKSKEVDMYVGVYMIGVLKTNTKVFFKDTI